MSNIFLSPTQMTNGIDIKNRIAIFDEIRCIERKILLAIDNGKRDVLINDSSFAITGSLNIAPLTYWKVSINKETNVIAQQNLNTVTQYFTDLGYTIYTKTNPVTGMALMWYIAW